MVSCENIETTGSTMVFNSQKVVKSFQIRDSTDVYGSTYVKNSMEVKNSDIISDSQKVFNSKNVELSTNVRSSRRVFDSSKPYTHDQLVITKTLLGDIIDSFDIKGSIAVKSSCKTDEYSFAYD